ncbi:APC family permease [Bradyrhizobium cosmicum]|uniref:APC family permease n=1 Tax=Bradyrhizobium cosmicum TaxID=1404864 RepID=UPI001161D5DF|nr:APC family permease [Bradyrhizobium cosmicum]QDP25389.1 APC family permease [Bradyrhizobium cosmicum]
MAANVSPKQEAPNQLRRNAVGVAHIVFFVVAAAAPLTAVVGVTPAAFAYGNGPGVPGTFLLVGLLYLLFSVGFTAMSKFINSAGGFYPYITAGLGRPAGVAGALIALATYNAIDIAVYGLFGFFANDIIKSQGGPDIAWWVYAFGLGIAVYFCGTRNIAFSGKVLGFCMIAEIAILLLLAVAILADGGGPESIHAAPFGPQAIFAKGCGVALVFVVSSFIGIEATVIFGEEARDPRRAIPRATYIAVSLIAVFYAFSTWAIALHYGPSNIQAEANAHIATIYISAVRELLGTALALIMNGLLLTSIFACALSFHNTINRYFFAIGREGLIWSGLARTNGLHGAPHVAGAVQTVLAMGITAIFAITGQDPYAVVVAWMGTFASLGILVIQVIVSIAAIAFFRKDRRGLGISHRVIAPGLSALGLGGCLVLMAANLAVVSGSDSLFVDCFPAMLAAIGAAGFGFAVWTRSRRPAVYANLGRAFE